MISKCIYFLVAILFVASAHGEICYVDSSDGGLPTVFYVRQLLEQQTIQLRKFDDGEHIPIDEERERLIWRRNYYNTFLDLVSGNISNFVDGLATLEQELTPVRAGRLVRLYSKATEASIDNLSADRFGYIYKMATESEFVRFGGAGEKQMVDASFAYVRHDTRFLKRLADKDVKTITNIMDIFAHGYTNLLYSELVYSPKSAKMAIEAFDRIAGNEKDTQECAGLRKGRISVHRARAYLVLLNGGQSNPVNYELAIQDAEIARQELNLLLTPVMWGDAHRVYSEILDVALSEKLVPIGYEVLSDIRDRSYELSLKYR